ncbi:MAG: amidase family protein [Ilumatobacteraceae bacterium]
MGSDHLDLARLDATAQAELVRSGTASPAELCEAAIERIERVNPELNAVIGERYERARREASSELPDGPFRGVPFLVKDLSLTMADESYHGGSRALKAADYRAAVDSYLFRKFRSAGLVTLGRTNTPEFGSTITTEPLAYGPARNPWNREHSTGGSSGGSAAAVAAGLVPMAHANDGGGSIRIPASECGLVGLKPSRGRVSSGPLSGETWMGATIEGVVTRSVRDTAAALDAIAGAMPGDPYTAPPFARPLVAELSADAGRLRIGVCPGPVLPGGLDHPECRAAVAATAAALAALGHEVEDTYPSAIGDEEFSNRFTAVVARGRPGTCGRWNGNSVGSSGPTTWRRTTSRSAHGAGRSRRSTISTRSLPSRRGAGGWWSGGLR